MTKTELKIKWDEVLSRFEKSGVDTLILSSFFQPLIPCKLSEKDNKIYFTLPSNDNIPFIKTMVGRYQDNIAEFTKEVFGSSYIAEILEDIPEEETEENLLENEDRFNPVYTFESFVAGPSSRFAAAASLAVADGYSKRYNPLFIYAGSGLGKTHLMHAIGHYVNQHKPRKKVLYVSSETFLTELSEAIRTKKQTEFKNKYRKVDYLLFDDVQFLADKGKFVEEELFGTFEELYNANKQIVFTSDKPPKEIEGFPDRIVSRFVWGMSVDIQPPEYETRIAILKNKAILDNLDVSNPDLIEVFELIAKSITKNIRELEGAYKRVYTYSALFNEPITVDLAKRTLSDLFTTEEKTITPESIKKAVADYYGIKVADLESVSRAKQVTVPRQIAIYIVREMGNYSFPQIGAMFGNRDHTTIMHSYEKICEEIKTSKEISNTIENIKTKI